MEKKPKVFVAGRMPNEVVTFLQEHCEISRWDSSDPLPSEVLFREIAEVEGFLTSGTRIDNTLLEAAPRLKVVSNMAVGYNNFDIPAMKQRNVIGTNTPYVLDDTVADLIMALMLSVARRIPELDKLVKEGRWVKGDQTPLFGLDVHHAKLGIVGMGRIGEAVARRAKLGFSMDVSYYNRTRKTDTEREIGVRYEPLHTLLAEADFVLLMTPLTSETTRFFGAQQFRLMKRTAFFINASRGQTVCEDELIQALQEGWIRGAGLDVFEKEPVDPTNPLLKMANVVTVPHIGSATAQTRFDMAMRAANNLVVGLSGHTPIDIIPELK